MLEEGNHHSYWLQYASDAHRALDADYLPYSAGNMSNVTILKTDLRAGQLSYELIDEVIDLEQQWLDKSGQLYPTGHRLAQSSKAGTPDPDLCSKGGRHCQQNVSAVFRLSDGSEVRLSLGRLAQLRGDQQPDLARVPEEQEGGRFRLHFICGSEPRDVKPPEGWDGRPPTLRRKSVEAGRASHGLGSACGLALQVQEGGEWGAVLADDVTFGVGAWQEAQSDTHAAIILAALNEKRHLECNPFGDPFGRGFWLTQIQQAGYENGSVDAPAHIGNSGRVRVVPGRAPPSCSTPRTAPAGGGRPASETLKRPAPPQSALPPPPRPQTAGAVLARPSPPPAVAAAAPKADRRPPRTAPTPGGRPASETLKRPAPPQSAPPPPPRPQAAGAVPPRLSPPLAVAAAAPKAVKCPPQRPVTWAPSQVAKKPKPSPPLQTAPPKATSAPAPWGWTRAESKQLWDHRWNDGKTPPSWNASALLLKRSVGALRSHIANLQPDKRTASTVVSFSWEECLRRKAAAAAAM